MAKFCTNCGSEIKPGANFARIADKSWIMSKSRRREQAELPRLPELLVLLPVPIQAIKKALATATIILSRELRLMLRR